MAAGRVREGQQGGTGSSVGRYGTWRRNLRGGRGQASGRTMGARKQQGRRKRSLQIQNAAGTGRVGGCGGDIREREQR